MTLNNRHQQCHPEVNSVLRISSQILRGITKDERGEKKQEKIGSAGGKRTWAGMQASSSLVVSFISVLPALVTSKACSHAAQCLPWIIETALRPAQSSLLNSPPRHSDTLQPRRDSFTLTHRNTVCGGLRGHQSQSLHRQGRKPASCAPQTRPFDLDQWISGTKSILWVQLLTGWNAVIASVAPG